MHCVLASFSGTVCGGCRQRISCAAGIIPEEVVEPMPDLLVALVKRLVRWGVLPARMAPDSAIINIYDVVLDVLSSLTADTSHGSNVLIMRW